MIKRGLLMVLIGSLGIGSSFASQRVTSLEQTSIKPVFPLSGTDTLALYQLVLSSKTDSASLVRDLPMTTLLNGDYLPFSSDMQRMGTVSLGLFSEELPTANTQTMSASVRTGTDGKDLAPGKDFQNPGMIVQPRPLHYSGEVGFMYGHSTGKFSGDEKQAYVIGEVDDGNTQITVGASYDDSNFRVPRHGR